MKSKMGLPPKDESAAAERSAAADHLRQLAMADVPEEHRGKWTEDKVRLGRAMMLAAADQIDDGAHMLLAMLEAAMRTAEESERGMQEGAND